MSSDSKKVTDSKITVILLNIKNNKSFTHTKSIKKLLGVNKISTFSSHEKKFKTTHLLLSALAAQSTTLPSSLRVETPEFDCTHLIRIPTNTKRNEFFDLVYGENIVGSFTFSLEEILELDALNLLFIQLLGMHQAPLNWIGSAEFNIANLSRLGIEDPTISDINLHYLKSVSDTYGLQALTECQAKISKWIDDHRWRYIG